jgi:phosphohistidine phosphatase SixA
MDMPLMVVRHANAGRRSAYQGDDRLRPLSLRGRDRATALVPLLSPYHPRTILSSPYVRCRQTVEPIADSLALPVEPVDDLAEGHGAEAVRLLESMAGESAVLCTHGDVALEILEHLAAESDGAGRASLRLQKGEVWVIESIGSTLTVVEHLRRASVKGGST